MKKKKTKTTLWRRLLKNFQKWSKISIFYLIDMKRYFKNIDILISYLYIDIIISSRLNNYVFVSSSASSFVAFTPEVVFQTWVKGIRITCTDMWMFAQMWEWFIRIVTETCKCLCKLWCEAQVRICKSRFMYNRVKCVIIIEKRFSKFQYRILCFFHLV